MSAPRFLVPHLVVKDDAVELPDAEARHLRQVLRLRPGEAARVFDGNGREWAGLVRHLGPRRVAIADLVAVSALPEPPVALTIGLAVLKGDQMDHAVRDATALGVSAIAPFDSAHVAVPGRAWRRRPQPTDRWRRVAEAAAKQCGRATVPAVRDVVTLEDLLDASRARLVVMAVEPAVASGAGVASLPAVDRVPDALVLVGPEGGWSPEELDRAGRLGVRLVQLGPRTLRAEITPAVLLAALWTHWGW